MEQKLKSYLRKTGRLLPESIKDVEHLLKHMPELTQLQGTPEEAMKILETGYTYYRYSPQQHIVSEDTTEFVKAAARNAGKLTDEIRRLMDSDREKAANNPEQE